MMNHSYIEGVKRVINSDLIAKATVLTKVGRSEQWDLICVFAESTSMEFYWIIRVEKPTDSPTAGRVVYYRARTAHNYKDLRSFVNAYVQGSRGRSVRSVEYNALPLAKLLTSKNLPVTAFTPIDEEQAALTRKVNKAFRRQAYGERGGFNG